MEQYFSNKPTSKDKNRAFEFIFEGQKFKFSSNNGVFSKDAVDFGTELLLKAFYLDRANGNMEAVKIVDAGCGIGIVGVILGKMFPEAKLLLFDINERALDLAKENCKNNHISNSQILISDLFSQVEDRDFDYILTNPPIRAGKQVIFNLYEACFHKLKDKGAVYVVIQKKQGADSTREKLIELFGNCSTLEKKSGFKILKSIKGSVHP